MSVIAPRSWVFTTAVNTESSDEYLEVVKRLLIEFEALPEVELRRKDANVGFIMYGLAMAAMRSASAAMTLYGQGFGPEATPLVRLVYEAGVKAQWVFQNRSEGFDALLDVGGRSSVRLLSQMDKAGFSVPEDLRKDIEGLKPRAAASKRLENFERVCTDLRGGDGLYLVYRGLSSRSHTGAQISYRYLTSDGKGGLTSALPRTNFGVEAWTLALGLVYSGRALDEWCKNKPRKKSLREAARQLGIPPMLLLAK